MIIKILLGQQKLKEKIKWKRKVYRDYLKNSKIEADHMYIQHAVTEVSQLASGRKDKSYKKLAMELNNPITRLAGSLEVFRCVAVHKLKVPQTCDDVRSSL